MGLAIDGNAQTSGGLGAALDGRAGHAAVQAIVTSPLEHGAARLLDLTMPDARPGSLQLLRSKYKPGRKLTGYYSVVEAEEPARRHVAVSWTADGQVRLLRSPVDPALPQLSRLSRPSTLGRLVEELSGRDRPAGSPRVTTVRYRPGQRHVLEARFPAGPAVYVKLDRDMSGARAVPFARFLRELFAHEWPAVRVADPVGFSATDRAALWWEAPGRRLGPAVIGEAGAASAVEQVGRAVRIIHDSSPALGEDPYVEAVAPRSVDSEVAGTLRAGEHIAALLPAVGVTYAHVVADVIAGLDRLPPEASTVTHGDLKSDNLLVDAHRLHILDLDRSTWAEPAIDLGKFLADLRWWSRSSQAAARLEAGFRAGYGECDPVRWARAELLATLFAVKFAARRCAVHDPNWESQVRGQVGRAARPLTSTGSR